MTWQKGQSGNPKGLPLGMKHAPTPYARRFERRAIRTLAYLCGDGDPAKTGIFPGVGTKPRDRIAAAKELLQVARLSALSEIPDDELRREVERRAALERAGGQVEAEVPPH